MSHEYQAWADEVLRLDRALRALEPQSRALGVGSPRQEEWCELLEHKLVPQVQSHPLLVVAVVGGTNIGKSLIFNHLAGCEASRSGPLAAGTRHPVCLVPSDVDDPAELARVFTGFSLQPWTSPEDPLLAAPTHFLYWRTDRGAPPRLVLVDAPDIDSSAEVNWQRADHVRQAADVLIAVLTEQKYNDAAVKQFFRKAAEADKPILVVFNQVDLDADRDYWPKWLETFRAETGADPEGVYVVPRDRAAAAELRLPFYEVGPEGRKPLSQPASLREELAQLRFTDIKIRTFRGALARVLDPRRGAPAHLERVRAACRDYGKAHEVLQAEGLVQAKWPPLPARALVEEIRDWWDDRRSDWSRKVHAAYRTLGRALAIPVRKAWEKVRGPTAEPLVEFQEEEGKAILATVEQVFAELDRLAQVGNDILRRLLEPLLSGDARSRLLEGVRRSYAERRPIDDDYRAFIRAELDRWESANPRAVAALRSVDQFLAVARPAITVSLFVGGWVVAGGVVHDAAVQAAGHTMGQLATETAITGSIAGGGEAAVNTAGAGLKQAAAQMFRRLQERYCEGRAQWLVEFLSRELLGDLLAELRRGAELPKGALFAELNASLAVLGKYQRSSPAESPRNEE